MALRHSCNKNKQTKTTRLAYKSECELLKQNSFRPLQGTSRTKVHPTNTQKYTSSYTNSTCKKKKTLTREHSNSQGDLKNTSVLHTVRQITLAMSYKILF